MRTAAANSTTALATSLRSASIFSPAHRWSRPSGSASLPPECPRPPDQLLSVHRVGPQGRPHQYRFSPRSGMSVISRCHLRHEVLRPSYVVYFEAGAATCLTTVMSLPRPTPDPASADRPEHQP